MDVETKLTIVREFAEEIITEKELRQLFETNDHPTAYDGFEPSGLAPIHFGLLRATNIKSMLKVGIKPKLYLADYFAFINNKIGGNLDDIQTVGKYFVEVWKACGIDMDKVNIVWASDIMDEISYWDKTLKIAKETTLERSMRATTIMGRKTGEKLSMAQLMYPTMQVTDIFHMDVDICQLGMDQRRANILAREIAEKLNWKKPVAVHHHILLGLQGLQRKESEEATVIASKMSKSDPTSAIYVHDDFKTIKSKIDKAYCPPKQEEFNPLMEYSKHLIFREMNEISLERPTKYGGDVTFKSYEELRDLYLNGKLHPQDLKNMVAARLNELIKPVREHFEENSYAKGLYDKVKSYKITR